MNRYKAALERIVALADRVHGQGLSHEGADADIYEDIARDALASQWREPPTPESGSIGPH